MAGEFEVPGHDEAVASVVAPAADDRDRRTGRKVVEERGGVSPGILHEHDARQSEVLDGAAIDVAHLGPCQRPHGTRLADGPRPRQRSLQ
jgi:hypothetical protein